MSNPPKNQNPEPDGEMPDGIDNQEEWEAYKRGGWVAVSHMLLGELIAMGIKPDVTYVDENKIEKWRH